MTCRVLGTTGLDVWKAPAFSLLGGPLSPLGEGEDRSTTKNLRTASCLLWAIAALSYGASSMRDANGGSKFMCCW